MIFHSISIIANYMAGNETQFNKKLIEQLAVKGNLFQMIYRIAVLKNYKKWSSSIPNKGFLKASRTI